MKKPKYPSLYQINTRVWLTELSEQLARPATLDDIPGAALDQLAEKGFDWIWFLSVWRTGEAAARISRENVGWRSEFQNTLPDLSEEDIAGSGFAITGYTVHPNLGGDEALSRLRERLLTRGLKMMLDFVPNHMAPDHPWVEEHPDYFIHGSQEDLNRDPQNYTLVKRQRGDLIIAYGRDPYFAGWPDTIQLDYSNPAARQAMVNELLRISNQCDGLRCDMAMLVLPEVFERTWGRKTEEFWLPATQAVREKHPEFLFMAEVYWNLEWALQQQGFDYTYDKCLYDRLREGHVQAIREHFYAEQDYQVKLARFMENHDEPRAAATFENDKHKAAALISFLSPGLRFFHQGEFEGRKIRISPHLKRAPQEAVDEDLQAFYVELLSVVKMSIFRDGSWSLLESRVAWEGNGSNNSFIGFGWESKSGEHAVVVVNYAPHASQCYLQVPFLEIADQPVRFKDLMSDAYYDRDGNEILYKGLYLDMPAWGYHAFELIMTEKKHADEKNIIVAPRHDLIPI